MTAIAWAFAACCFAAWCIEHVGGRDARDRLRADRNRAIERADAAEARAEWSERRVIALTRKANRRAIR